MDTDAIPVRATPRHPVAGPGGTVAPANRAALAKALFQTPLDEPQTRYELRDPFAEVTYRAPTFAAMVAKADELGSHRFVEVDTQGRRTPILKVDGRWERDGQPAPTHRRADNPPQPDPDAKPPITPRREAIETVLPTATIDAEAEHAARIAHLEAALVERYLIKRAPVTVGDLPLGRTEYRFRGDTSRVAFTESTFRLATDTNSPSVARSMVDVAEARNWRALRVSGNEDFRRLVWLEAAVRGVKTLGYEPHPADLDLLRQAREARQVNRIEPAPIDAEGTTPSSPDKVSTRGVAGRKAVIAAIEAVLVAKRVPDAQREAILAAAGDKLAQRIRDGQVPKVKVYDKAAPSQRTVVMPTPELQRTHDRRAPAPGR